MQRVFIGSSKEGSWIMEMLRDELATKFNVTVWKDSFEDNLSSFDNLLNKADLYDFAILILTADDLRSSRNQLEFVGRDNVIFEFGLFLGRLERRRAFLLVESGTKKPSDLEGISFSHFDLKDNAFISQNSDQLKGVVCELVQKINQNSRSSEFGLLPSTALALGYFQNFLLPLAKEIDESSINFRDNDYAKARISVLVPESFEMDFDRLCWTNGWVNQDISRKDGSRVFGLKAAPFEQKVNVLQLIDFPTTLNTLKSVVEKYVAQPNIGYSRDLNILTEKELKNFFDTLRFLIAESEVGREVVRLFRDTKTLESSIKELGQ